MKKIILAISVFLSLAMVGCSCKDNSNGNEVSKN